MLPLTVTVPGSASTMHHLALQAALVVAAAFVVVVVGYKDDAKYCE